MKTCTRCVMPETAETLSFNDHGVCSVCKQIDYKRETVDWAERDKKLREIADSVRGGEPYDCILPFSGGKDSTFTLWYVVKELKLKPLVVRFDHGFLRPTVQDNSLRTFRRLGVDVVQFTPNWQIVRKLMFEALKRRGDFCWHCHTGIYCYPVWEAIRQEVPLIIWGEPSAEYASFWSYEEEEPRDDQHYNLTINLGLNPEDIVHMLDDTVSDYPVTLRDLKPYMFPPAKLMREKRVRQLYLGSFIPWDVRKQVDLIKSELGWKGDEVEGIPPEYDYEKIECFMQGVRDYIKYLKRGFGRTAHLTSIDIRNGRMDRATAEQLTEQYDGRRPAALDLFLDFLGLSEQQFVDLVATHVVDPHVLPDEETIKSRATNQRPWDFDQWQRESGRT
jgi:N-acetyl sugar amidotransferase